MNLQSYSAIYFQQSVRLDVQNNSKVFDIHAWKEMLLLIKWQHNNIVI